MNGTVYLVGAGPGAPDLLTVRATRLLARADVVFYDALVHPEVLAIARDARKFHVGKRCGAFSVDQRFIITRLVSAARESAVVVRLKGGDPMLFGRAQEEIDGLRTHGIACEVVPGISAAFAASAEMGVSLTERGIARTVTFATARTGRLEPQSTWLESVLAADTCALYMAGRERQAVARALLAGGKAPGTPVVVVESVSAPGRSEQAIPLAGLAVAAPAEAAGPVLLLIGAVFRRRLPAHALDPAARFSAG